MGEKGKGEKKQSLQGISTGTAAHELHRRVIEGSAAVTAVRGGEELAFKWIFFSSVFPGHG